MLHFFQTNFKKFALLSVQNLYSVQCVLPGNMHAYSLHSLWRISLIWAGNFSLALDFPFKYWPLRPSTLCWADLSILYCTTWYNIWMQHDNDGYRQFTGHYGGHLGFISDFVTNTYTYGASRYSSNLWKIMSSSPEPMSPS